MKKLIFGAMIALTACSWSQVIDKNQNPGTLVPTTYHNYMLDRTARAVGDIVTIVVNESSAASLAANTSLSKTDTNSIGIKTFVDFFDRLLKPMQTNASSSNAGTGSTNQTAKFTATISATIKEVRPNGVLVFEANKTLLINKELQTLRLTGCIRRDDIAADNTIPSEKIADSDMKVSGQGGIADRQRRGILTRILDWLF